MKISKEVQAQARRLMRLCIGADGLMNEATVRLVADKIAADLESKFGIKVPSMVLGFGKGKIISTIEEKIAAK